MGAKDMTYFTINGVHYLAVASNRQNVISSPQTSRLYRWDPSTRLFLQHQDLSTTRVAAIRSLTMEDGTGERCRWGDQVEDGTGETPGPENLRMTAIWSLTTKDGTYQT